MNEEGRHVVEERERVDHVPDQEEAGGLDERLEYAKRLIHVVQDEANGPGRVDEEKDGVGGEYGDEEHAALALVAIRLSAGHQFAHLPEADHGERVEHEYGGEGHQVAHHQIDHVGGKVQLEHHRALIERRVSCLLVIDGRLVVVVVERNVLIELCKRVCVCCVGVLLFFFFQGCSVWLQMVGEIEQVDEHRAANVDQYEPKAGVLEPVLLQRVADLRVQADHDGQVEIGGQVIDVLLPEVEDLAGPLRQEREVGVGVVVDGEYHLGGYRQRVEHAQPRVQVGERVVAHLLVALEYIGREQIEHDAHRYDRDGEVVAKVFTHFTVSSCLYG